MRQDKQKRLEAAGWRVGDAAEFLGPGVDDQPVERQLTWPRRPDHEDMVAIAAAMTEALLTGSGRELARLLERVGVCRRKAVNEAAKRR